MRKLFILLIILSSCKTKQPIVVSYTDMRDSTKLEIVATPRVVEQFIKEVNETERHIASTEKRSSIVAAKTALKQVVSDNKKQVAVAKSDNAVKKVETVQENRTERKEIKQVIVAKKQFPNSIKWLSFLVLVLIIGYITIKNKIPFLK